MSWYKTQRQEALHNTKLKLIGASYRVMPKDEGKVPPRRVDEGTGLLPSHDLLGLDPFNQLTVDRIRQPVGSDLYADPGMPDLPEGFNMPPAEELISLLARRNEMDPTLLQSGDGNLPHEEGPHDALSVASDLGETQAQLTALTLTVEGQKEKILELEAMVTNDRKELSKALTAIQRLQLASQRLKSLESELDSLRSGPQGGVLSSSVEGAEVNSLIEKDTEMLVTSLSGKIETDPSTTALGVDKGKGKRILNRKK
jgi:hypothetical protein